MWPVKASVAFICRQVRGREVVVCWHRRCRLLMVLRAGGMRMYTLPLTCVGHAGSVCRDVCNFKGWCVLPDPLEGWVSQHRALVMPAFLSSQGPQRLALVPSEAEEGGQTRARPLPSNRDLLRMPLSAFTLLLRLWGTTKALPGV